MSGRVKQRYHRSNNRSRSARLAVGIALFFALGLGHAFRPKHLCAQDPDPAADLDTPRGIAMGAGGRASAQSANALAYNPANLSLGGVYHINVFTGYAPGSERWNVGGSIVDSMTNQNIAMGISFRGVIGNGDEGYSGFDGRLALAIPFSPQISFGVGGRYVSLEQDGQSTSSGHNDGDTRAKGFTMDAALRFTPAEGLNIAALAQNFIDRDSELVPFLLGGAASYSLDIFTIAGDILFDMTTFEDPELIAGVGGELLLGANIPVRAGYKFDAGRDDHFISGGLGYVDQVFGVDVGLRQQVSGGDETYVMGSISYFHH